LLFFSFIPRGSYYLVWPVLAGILYDKFILSASQVVLILSSAAVIAVLVNFVGSALSDRIGRYQLIYASGILCIISFSLLAQVNLITGYALVITLYSIAAGLWRPVTSALIGDIIKDKATRELAMQSLYFVVNLGPMLGLCMGLIGEQSSFYITAGAFVFLLVLLWWGFNQHTRLGREDVVNAQTIVTDMVDGDITTTLVEVNSQATLCIKKNVKKRLKRKTEALIKLLRY
jgi:MFS family permease